MVSLTLWLILGIVGAAGPEPEPGPASSPNPDLQSAAEADLVVRPALGRGGFPWYDAKTDAVVPIWPPRERSFGWLDRWFGRLRWIGRLQFGSLQVGELLIIGMVILALSVLLVLLVELWRRYQPSSDDSEPGVTSIAKTERIEGLPAGVRPETDDPWAEAVRCRAVGDYARATVCLFAHQLLALNRLRLVRLRPGRTGRQLVRAIDDPRFQMPVEATLRLFEAVYYGHLTPSAEDFDAVWTLAEDFERLGAVGPVS